jgi:hypothetical protein
MLGIVASARASSTHYSPPELREYSSVSNCYKIKSPPRMRATRLLRVIPISNGVLLRMVARTDKVNGSINKRDNGKLLECKIAS